MKAPAMGYQVAVVGSSSLLGRELLALLKERNFPVPKLIKHDGKQDNSEISTLESEEASFDAASDDSLSDCDFIFLAGDPGRELPVLQGEAQVKASGSAKSGRPTIIALTGGDRLPEGVLSIPFLDGAAGERGFVAPHAATIVLSALMLRFSARFPVERAVGTIFLPASECGSQAIEELHKQTADVLSFQKLTKEIFGAQLAFNLLPRLGGTAGAEPEKLEARLRSELHRYLGGRIELPSLRLIHVPAFYSIAVSLYIETESPAPIAAVEQSLTGKPVRFSKADELPSLVSAAGSSEILVDRLYFDPARPEGIWIWAVADNLRLAAENAIRIAERAREAGRA
jgi:aspartate-semialdehyde dehydrogenase